ncbi:MAG: hypothetical protein R2854_04535 [Caldilineaceae bacterium]
MTTWVGQFTMATTILPPDWAQSASSRSTGTPLTASVTPATYSPAGPTPA